MDLEQSNNINNTYNDIINDDINNYKFVKTLKGEIIENNLEEDLIDEFKSSKEYNEMIFLYKNKIYPDFIQSIEKTNTEENESESEKL